MNYLHVKKSNSAYYRPSTDEVVVPLLEQFKNENAFYATLFHEMVHSTGSPKRCKRFKENEKLQPFGSPDYSKEELVAEMGSAFLCTVLGINTEKTERNSVAYIQSWIRVLKNDTHFIVSASARAKNAAKYILGDLVESEVVNNA